MADAAHICRVVNVFQKQCKSVLWNISSGDPCDSVFQLNVRCSIADSTVVNQTKLFNYCACIVLEHSI